MKPFCGYNFGDYFAHWLSFDRPARSLPKIFHVNWFRKGEDGKFLWPGFGDNLRVLEWIIDRCEGRASGKQTPIGTVPAAGELKLDALALDPQTLDTLLHIDQAGWQAELADIGEYLRSFGERMPQQLHDEQQRVAKALDDAAVTPRAAAAR